MKQTELALIFGVSQAYISGIVNAVKRPSYKLSKKMEELTGIPKETFLEGSHREIKAALAAWAERQKSEQPEQAA